MHIYLDMKRIYIYTHMERESLHTYIMEYTHKYRHINAISKYYTYSDSES